MNCTAIQAEKPKVTFPHGGHHVHLINLMIGMVVIADPNCTGPACPAIYYFNLIDTDSAGYFAETLICTLAVSEGEKLFERRD